MNDSKAVVRRVHSNRPLAGIAFDTLAKDSHPANAGMASTLEVLGEPVPPYDGSFDGSSYLNERLTVSGDPVWFAFRVPRSGMAPALKRWLVAHTELMEERVWGRIDRRERVLSGWYRDG